MDGISCAYVEHFMKLAGHWRDVTLRGSLWTRHDLRLLRAFAGFTQTFVQPWPDLLEIEPYYYFEHYGLRDLPEEIHRRIDGRIIVDGGAFTGDTALMFHRFYPHSPVYAFEPGSKLQTLQAVLSRDDCGGMIRPEPRGLAREPGRIHCNCPGGMLEAEVTAIDAVCGSTDRPVGLIKLDTESHETRILEGARGVILRDRPVLAVAMYHTPYDFFHLKAWVQQLVPGYRFMIRRSEAVLPQADLVLLAWHPD